MIQTVKYRFNFHFNKLLKNNALITLRVVYETQTILLNGVSVSDTYISVDTRMTLIGKVFNSKDICWIFENSNTVLTQF